MDVARLDIDEIPAVAPDGGAAAVAYVVLGTVLYEPLLLALRRLAQGQIYVGRKGTHAGRSRG
jgi:hypothetical protein